MKTVEADQNQVVLYRLPPAQRQVGQVSRVNQAYKGLHLAKEQAICAVLDTLLPKAVHLSGLSLEVLDHKIQE